MLLYDSRTLRKEPFIPQSQPVTIYVCGITPYDTTHLGHAFTYVFFDTVIRFLRFQGNETRYVQNVTDVDDDIMRKSRELGTTWDALSETETRRYQRDMASLNVLPPDVFPRASGEIAKILEIIRVLMDRGFAYQSNGNVYFSVEKDPDYGSLSHLSREEMLPIANQRGNNPDDSHKRHPLDFVLWQESLPDEPRWDSPWGAGRPGWHIECSAMALHYLGDMVDIHGGGADLLFPHHESEIAQSVHYTGRHPFVRHWVHTAMVELDGEKMSKSLGNLVLVRKLLEHHTADAIRLMLLGHRHTESWAYTGEEMDRASRLADRLSRAAQGSRAPLQGSAAGTDEGASFVAAMEDDLDTPTAIGVLAELADSLLSGAPDGHTAQRRPLLVELGGVLGLKMGMA